MALAPQGTVRLSVKSAATKVRLRDAELATFPMSTESERQLRLHFKKPDLYLSRTKCSMPAGPMPTMCALASTSLQVLENEFMHWSLELLKLVHVCTYEFYPHTTRGEDSLRTRRGPKSLLGEFYKFVLLAST